MKGLSMFQYHILYFQKRFMNIHVHYFIHVVTIKCIFSSYDKSKSEVRCNRPIIKHINTKPKMRVFTEFPKKKKKSIL